MTLFTLIICTTLTCHAPLMTVRAEVCYAHRALMQPYVDRKVECRPA